MVWLGVEPVRRGIHWAMAVPKPTDCRLTFFFKKKWANPGLFFVYFRSFSNKQYNFLQQINVKNVMSIQYPVPRFEPTSFRMQVSSHNH